MANRSDREQGQPNGRSRHHSLLNEMGLSSRTPSGPAVLNGCTNRPTRELHPTLRQIGKSPLQRGSHPQRASASWTWPSSPEWLEMGRFSRRPVDPAAPSLRQYRAYTDDAEELVGSHPDGRWVPSHLTLRAGYGQFNAHVASACPFGRNITLGMASVGALMAPIIRPSENLSVALPNLLMVT